MVWPFTRSKKAAHAAAAEQSQDDKEDAVPDAFDDSPATAAPAAPAPAAVPPAPAAKPAAAPAVSDCAEVKAAAGDARAAVQRLGERHAAAKARCAKLETDLNVSQADRAKVQAERDALSRQLDKALADLAEATVVVSAKVVGGGGAGKAPCAGDCEAEAVAAFRAIQQLADNA